MPARVAVSMKPHYFNEFDPGAAAWLRELVKAGHLPAGEIDERSITEVQADDLRGYSSCHFFAGIGGWPYALSLAGWGSRRVWTGSCPCQPYSAAGKRLGDADERNLWPHFFRLIRECRPDTVFGEQVEGAIRHGWLDRVSADLEGEGYAVGAAVLGAHSTGQETEGWVCYDDGGGHVDYVRERISLGAPHIRQRLFWVAHAGPIERVGRPGEFGPAGAEAAERREEGVDHQRGGAAFELEHAPRDGREQGRPEPGGRGDAGGRGPGILGDADQPGLPVPEREAVRRAGRREERRAAEQPSRAPDVGFWSAFDLIPCRDGKLRRVPAGCLKPGVQRVADGLPGGVGGAGPAGVDLHPLCAAKVPGRVGLLRGFGNAIVPAAAAEFVKAFLEVTEG